MIDAARPAPPNKGRALLREVSPYLQKQAIISLWNGGGGHRRQLDTLCDTSHGMTIVTRQQDTMTDPVEKLKAAIGVETDIGLAAKLGLERSAIAQWRRRGAVPTRYFFMLDPKHRDSVRQGMRHADRRAIYGDGPGRFTLSAALAFTPTAALDFPDALSPANVGWSRESRLLSVVQVVVDACSSVLGKARCETDAEYLQLVAALEQESWQERIRAALAAPAIGER